jgi:hypothetical protein
LRNGPLRSRRAARRAIDGRRRSRAALDSWLVKWGGARGATPGTGRDGYLAMRAILNARQPSEQQLKDVMGVLAKMLAG